MSEKKDFAWEYVKQVEGAKYIFCKFCEKQCSGTISRLKNHLAGTHLGIAPCKNVPDEVKSKCASALKKLKDNKAKEREILDEIRMSSVGGSNTSDGATQVIHSSESRQVNVRGPMDKFAHSDATAIASARQSTLNSRWKKEERKDVCRKIGRFIFSKALSFNVVNDPYWLPMIEGIGNFGPGLKPPSMHELKTWVLKEEVEDINKQKIEHEKAWKTYGCSIMSDGWSDGKGRTLINFLVNSPAGTWFLKSVDASDSIKTGELLFKLLDDVVEEVGEDNVVQIITDNASNYVFAGKRLMEKRKNLYWTPCAAHCIDLILEDIAKLNIFKDTIAKAREVVKYIYGHAWVLALMREHTKNHEIIRPAVTRFATAFLTLQSLYKQRQPLMSMFTSEKWDSSRWAKKIDGVKVCAIILHDTRFWSSIAHCVKSVSPLVCVLREVDSEERPAMGYIYELMDRAKEKIQQNCGENIRKYGPIWNKIDARWTPQLHQPLHAAGYYLNPSLRYEDTFSNVEEVKQGLSECMERMLPYEDRLRADLQLDAYDHCRLNFGTQVAIDTRKLRSPGINNFI